MELQLNYQATAKLPLSAAYLAGSPTDWYAEISLWKVDVTKLQCFKVPASISNNACKGILVIFSQSERPNLTLVKYPYAKISEGFFIPLHAQLFPTPLADELNSLKLWHVQLFHPNIGLVGFEQKDVCTLIDFFHIGKAKESNWIAHLPEASALPRLFSISLESTMQGDAMDNLKDLIDAQPLNEIPKADHPQKDWLAKLSKLTRPFVTLGMWILFLIIFILGIIGKIISFIIPKSNVGFNSRSTPSFLQKMEKWINQQLQNLEKQRDSELNRLVNLFDKDKDLALKYAIPLNSPYLSRGTAPKSGKLRLNPFNFNFKSFGGDGAVDAWDLGNYEWVLKRKYEEAATQAIEHGDYKKAAYIYAHLLGDLSRAAHTLKEGKFYREAASMYKDHVKNLTLAANCLESGGLLSDAIPLYIELENYEKAGDLYVQLDQPTQANKYYEETIAKSLVNKDYLNASRLAAIKLEDLERGQQTLLDGWKDSNQAELCLQRYIEGEAQQQHELSKTVGRLFKSHVTKTRQVSFLSVVANIVDYRSDPQLEAAALQICYEVANAQSAVGNFSALKMLARFMPNDQLILRDVHHYAIKNHRTVKQISTANTYQLNGTTNWIDFCSYHDQLIGIGSNNGDFQLLRMNWDGLIDYTYLGKINDHYSVSLVGDMGISNQILLAGKEMPNHQIKRVADRNFERELFINQLNWWNEKFLHAAVNQNPDLLTIIVQHDNELRLNTYTLHNKLMSSAVCTLNASTLNAYDLMLRPSKMYWRKDHFYFTGASSLIRCTDNGILEVLPFENEVIDFSITGNHTALKIAILIPEGCSIIAPTLSGMELGIPMFATNFNAHLVQLLPDNYLVLASNEKIRIYELLKSSANLIAELTTNYPILKIFPVAKRHHFALLNSNNQISVHKVPQLEL